VVIIQREQLAGFEPPFGLPKQPSRYTDEIILNKIRLNKRNFILMMLLALSLGGGVFMSYAFPAEVKAIPMVLAIWLYFAILFVVLRGRRIRVQSSFGILSQLGSVVLLLLLGGGAGLLAGFGLWIFQGCMGAASTYLAFGSILGAGFMLAVIGGGI